MAMTKAEKAAVETLKTEVALRWPTEAEPQPMTREYIAANLVTVKLRDQSIRKTRDVARGWWFNAHTQRIEQGWSDGNYHGWGNDTGAHASQGMGRIYRSKRDALIAMRWEVCRDFARKLRTIDQQIEDEAAA